MMFPNADTEPMHSSFSGKMRAKHPMQRQENGQMDAGKTKQKPRGRAQMT